MTTTVSTRPEIADRPRSERVAAAYKAAADAVRQTVGERALALLIGGRWKKGDWTLIDIAASHDGGPGVLPGNPVPTHWISYDSRVVPVEHVQGVQYAAARFTPYRAALAEIDGAERCDGSAELALVEDGGRDDEGLPTTRPAEAGTQVWCGECEHMAGVREETGGEPVLVEHDKLGRTIGDGIVW